MPHAAQQRRSQRPRRRFVVTDAHRQLLRDVDAGRVSWYLLGDHQVAVCVGRHRRTVVTRLLTPLLNHGYAVLAFDGASAATGTVLSTPAGRDVADLTPPTQEHP